MICEHPECTGWHTRVTGSGHQRVAVPQSRMCPAYIEKKRALDANSKRKQRAREAGKDLTEIEPVKYDNEVKVVPGQCIAWTVRGGHCYNPANGRACAEHAWDFADAKQRNAARRTRLTDEDYEWLATLPTCEREKARKRLVSQRAREDPEYKAREDERRRTRKTAA